VEEKQSNWESARRLYREASALFGELGDERSAAGVRAGLGRLALRAGEVATAREELAAAVETLRRCDSRLDLASVLLDLAEVAQAQSDLDAARACCDECLHVRAALGEVRRLGPVLERLARVAEEEGEPVVAVRYLAAMEHLRQRLGEPVDRDSDRAAWLNRLQSQLAPAAFQSAWEQGDGLLDELLC
jgi:tetratricopeptide (TPR) repeat protein